MNSHDEPLPAADALLASIHESIKLKEKLVGAASGQAYHESAQAFSGGVAPPSAA